MLRIGVLRAKNGGRRPPLSRQGYRICVASISAVIPGAAQHEVLRCRPGTQVPRHQKKGTAGVLGSRLSLRSAGMTTEETAPYAIALPRPGRGGASGMTCASMTGKLGYPQPRRLKWFASFRFRGQRAFDAVTRVTFVLWCLCTGGHEAKSGVEDVSPAALPYSRSSG